MCTMALILSGLALIPITDTRQPRTLTFCTPKHISLGLTSTALRMLVNVSAKSFILVAFFFACHHNVVNVRENISLHLVFEDGPRHPTECWASILETFGHPEIAICAERCNKACFLFILIAEPDLMVSEETI
jgi:hypothetical protein